MPLDAIRLHNTEAGAKATPSIKSSRLVDEISRLDQLLVQADKVL